MIFKDFLNRKSQEHPRRPVALTFLFCLLYAFCHCEKSTLSYNEDGFGDRTLAPNITPEAWTRITTTEEADKGDSAELTTVLAPDTTPEAWTRITTTEEAGNGDSWITKSWKI